MGELENAYRRRAQWATNGFLAAAVILIGISHFVYGPAFFVLIAAGLASVGLSQKGEPLLFPLAWRAFDALRPSPVLEDEAQDLAKQMRIPLSGLRLKPGHSKWPGAKWKGRTLIVSTALRDLPDDERRFAIARHLVTAPDAIHIFAAYAAAPLFYASFAGWCFDIRPLSAIIGGATVLTWFISTIHTLNRRVAADTRALEITQDPVAALAYWHRMQSLGFPGAAKKIAALQAIPADFATPLPLPPKLLPP